jgi:hypothetical protein
LFALLILVELLTTTVYCSFCWYWWNGWPSLFIVCFVDISGIVDHHCLLFVLLILVELLTITVYCLFCWYWWNYWPSLFIVCFVDIGGIVTNNKQWWSTIPLISTKQTANSDGQQFHQYQQNKQ